MKVPLSLAHMEAAHQISIHRQRRVQHGLIYECEVASRLAEFIRHQRKSDNGAGGGGKQVGISYQQPAERVALGALEFDAVGDLRGI